MTRNQIDAVHSKMVKVEEQLRRTQHKMQVIADAASTFGPEVNAREAALLTTAATLAEQFESLLQHMRNSIEASYAEIAKDLL